jgi:hypothetical protein
MFVHCCHCLICQKQTGSSFVVNGLIETDQLVLTRGTLAVTQMPTESGRGHELYRCPTCLVPLWSNYSRRSYLRFLRLSTLDEPHRFPPDLHIYTRSKAPWVQLPPGARAFAEYYEITKEWPAASLARRQAAEASAQGASRSS